ncbi:peptidylprolyl isomerase [Aestuariibacter halophilus]|uniref:Peptidyl-prolyl cis-trans isomerase n=1 Tax=Fluctibacter halophilus TaxID=226011 RepID=A0ABS8G5M4_9ALTE|nr:peptidylprolyl isomerase [Aestuariibacter halophilus]MCC2615803.1 peptidylprolyl isomerase [Aestuariibacter halophilus]
MNVSKDTVVQFHYRITDEQGTELESSFDQHPALYLHGHNNMMPGVEQALDGKATGDRFSVELGPEVTFGEIQADAEQRVSVKHLMGAKQWKPGMVAVVNTDQGQRQVTVKKVGKFMATVDLNHPLAGKTLNFELAVESVRAASAEELEHGHAHGVGGHQH